MNTTGDASSYTLGGTISGAGGSEASVELAGASSASAMANSSGVYSFTGLQNGNYTITPSNEGYVMTPASQAVTLNGANATANFSSSATYTISGAISGAGGPGALVTLTGASSASVTANESGQYSFTGFPNGSYTVTPTNHGYVMTPLSQSVTVNGANATANFMTHASE
jgi:Carboxypeptidase regulatory-like domain